MALGEIDFAVVSQRQSRFVEDPEKQVPQGVACLLNLIKKDEADFDGVRVMLVDHFLAQKGMRFTMSQIAWGRTDQFGNFMAVLKFGAVDLHDRARVLNENLRRRFHRACLARAGGSEKQEVSNGASRRGEARQIHLVNTDNLVDRLVLANNQVPQRLIERLSVSSGSGRVKRFMQPVHFGSLFFPPATSIKSKQVAKYVGVSSCFLSSSSPVVS